VLAWVIFEAVVLSSVLTITSCKAVLNVTSHANTTMPVSCYDPTYCKCYRRDIVQSHLGKDASAKPLKDSFIAEARTANLLVEICLVRNSANAHVP
jgi:hypothetical protein